jgi:hypothetical protein
MPVADQPGLRNSMMDARRPGDKCRIARASRSSVSRAERARQRPIDQRTHGLAAVE